MVVPVDAEELGDVVHVHAVGRDAAGPVVVLHCRRLQKVLFPHASEDGTPRLSHRVLRPWRHAREAPIQPTLAPRRSSPGMLTSSRSEGHRPNDH